MTNLWPWLSIAGLGALHGLSPAGGWMFAAACGLHTQRPGASRRALLPIGMGHAASVAVVALAVSQGMRLDFDALRRIAGAMLLALAAASLLLPYPGRPVVGAEASTAGMALWSFLISSAQGSGLMLVPALVPMCLAASPAREITASGSVLLALGAIAVHAGAMLATTGAMATGICRLARRRTPSVDLQPIARAWAALLLLGGIFLLIPR